MRELRITLTAIVPIEGRDAFAIARRIEAVEETVRTAAESLKNAGGVVDYSASLVRPRAIKQPPLPFDPKPQGEDRPRPPSKRVMSPAPEPVVQLLDPAGRPVSGTASLVLTETNSGAVGSEVEMVFARNEHTGMADPGETPEFLRRG